MFLPLGLLIKKINMKRSLYIYIFTFITLLSFSCSKMVEGLNDNPNQPSSTSPDLLLTGLQLGTVTFHSGQLSRHAGLLSGYFKGTDRQYQTFYNYMIINANFNTHWANAYRIIRNAYTLEQLAKEDNREGVIVGISKVLAAHTMGTIAALWGDVPFREAGRYVEFNNPQYDAQLEVYEGVQNMLNDAIESLRSPVGRPVANADVFFDGNPEKWIRVAYSLKARFYLHLGEYEQALANAKLGIISPSDNWLADFFVDELNGENLYEQFYRGNRAGDLETSGTYFYELLSPSGAHYRGDLKTNETARFNYLVRTEGNRAVNNTTSSGAFGATSSYPLFTFEENLLILSESAFHQEGFNSALEYLNELREYYSSGAHIGSNYHSLGFLYEPYFANDFSPGGIASYPNLSQEDNLLRKILEEKYVLTYSSVEGFNDLRRVFGEPYAMEIPTNNGNRQPQRFLYPQSELDRNVNIPKEIPNLYDKTPANE